MTDSSSQPRQGVPRWQMPRWGWLVLTCIPLVVLAILHFNELPDRDASDYAQYLLHAKALVEGRAYDDVGYLFTRHNILLGPRVQPPGWPLLLTPGVALFGTGLTFPKLLTIALAALFLVLAAARMSRGQDPVIGLLAAAFAGLALESFRALNTPLSDLPFAAAMWGVILILDDERPLTWGRLALVGVLASYAVLLRIAGVALIGGIALYAFLGKRDSRKLFVLLGCWVLGGVLAVWRVGVDSIPFLRAMIRRGPEIIVGRFGGNVKGYGSAVFESLLYPFPGDVANDVYHVVAGLLLLLGAAIFLRRYARTALGGVTIATVLMLAVAPVRGERYTWPLWPVSAWCFIAGLDAVIKRLRGAEGARIWTPRLTLALMAVAFVVNLQRPAPPSLLDRADAREVFDWVRTEQRRGPVRVVFVSPRVLTLETGAPAMGFFEATPEATVREFARFDITHIIAGTGGVEGRELKSLEGLIASHPAYFTRVLHTGAFTIYRIDAAGLASALAVEPRDGDYDRYYAK